MSARQTAPMLISEQGLIVGNEVIPDTSHISGEAVMKESSPYMDKSYLLKKGMSDERAIEAVQIVGELYESMARLLKESGREDDTLIGVTNSGLIEIRKTLFARTVEGLRRDRRQQDQNSPSANQDND